MYIAASEVVYLRVEELHQLLRHGQLSSTKRRTLRQWTRQTRWSWTRQRLLVHILRCVGKQARSLACGASTTACKVSCREKGIVYVWVCVCGGGFICVSILGGVYMRIYIWGVFFICVSATCVCVGGDLDSIYLRLCLCLASVSVCLHICV
jgi:hypothetical protein